jgi:hypothetical protein
MQLKFVLVALAASSVKSSYDTDAGFIEGTGYMDQSRNYGYEYYYCGDVKNNLGSVCCTNTTGMNNLKRDTGFDVACECYWIESDVCKKQVNVVLACITPFVVLVFWLVLGVFCGKNGGFVKCSYCLDPCDVWNMICKTDREGPKRDNIIRTSYSDSKKRRVDDTGSTNSVGKRDLIDVL